MYLRDDIYFCKGCGNFHDSETHKNVFVPYHAMPPEYADYVRKYRAKLKAKKRSNKVQKIYKGFAK